MKSSLYYDVSGAGQPLVWLHGWGVNGSVFQPLLGQLPQYRSYCVDLPGFGNSPASAPELAAWVKRLADELPDNAIWIGWSLGGLLATKLALTYPERVRGLVTVASSPCFMAQPASQWPGIAPHVLAQFGQQLTQDLPLTVERFLAIQAMGSESARADIRQLKERVLAKPLPQMAALSAGLHMLQQVDLRAEISRIQCPWLRLWGRLDSLVPSAIVAQMPQGAHCEDIVLAKASHAPFISHPTPFLAHLQQWFESKGFNFTP